MILLFKIHNLVVSLLFPILKAFDLAILKYVWHEVKIWFVFSINPVRYWHWNKKGIIVKHNTAFNAVLLSPDPPSPNGGRKGI